MIQRPARSIPPTTSERKIADTMIRVARIHPPNMVIVMAMLCFTTMVSLVQLRLGLLRFRNRPNSAWRTISAALKARTRIHSATLDLNATRVEIAKSRPGPSVNRR